MPVFSWLHPHLRSALVQCATQTTLLVQVRLGGGDAAWNVGK